MDSIYAYFFLVVFCFAYGTSYSQEKKDKQNADNFSDYGYMVPIESYSSLLNKGFDKATIYKKLGNANFLNAEYDVATFWYEKLTAMEGIEVSPEYLYRYAQALKSIKDYEGSKKWMERFQNVQTQDIRADLYAQNTDYLKSIRIPKEQYTIKNLSKLNSKESDFAPAYYFEDLVFATARDLEYSAKYNDLSYLNLYQAKLSVDGESGSLSPFSKDLNTPANESSAAFTKDGNTLYFTRNNFSKKSFKRDKKGVSRLKIYRASRENGIWGKVEDLPFNSTKYSVAHPTLNIDGTKLYFSSDMPGGQGASDIYVVDVLPDGGFGIPQNLGKPVNTESRETFPFMADSGTLYFASDGHPGLGGLDVFKVDLQNVNEIENLGSPINSPEDDFSLVMDSSEESGFFASNRKGGQGSDDIYHLQKNSSDCFTFIEGKAIDKDSDKPLAKTSVTAFDYTGKKIGDAETASDGSYTIRIPCQEKQYRLEGAKNGYEKGSLFLLTSDDKNYINETKLQLEQLSKVADIGSDLVKVLKLNPIYFDLNSSYLRRDAYTELNKVVDYMTRRPEIKIAVGSHTDSRESDSYNLWLSDRRAKRTVAYLISKGITANRINGKGYGETQLINKCANGVWCPDRQHQLNRRSEFIVIEK